MFFYIQTFLLWLSGSSKVNSCPTFELSETMEDLFLCVYFSFGLTSLFPLPFPPF